MPLLNDDEVSRRRAVRMLRPRFGLRLVHLDIGQRYLVYDRHGDGDGTGTGWVVDEDRGYHTAEAAMQAVQAAFPGTPREAFEDMSLRRSA